MMLPLALAYARKYWKAGLVVATLIGVATTVAYIQQLRYERDELLLGKNNALASVDSLKVKYSTDSTIAVGILAFTRQELLRLGEQEGKAKTVTTVVAAPHKRKESHQGQPTNLRGDTLMLADSVLGPPADVWVTVRALGGTADWSWRVEPAPIKLTVDVGCLERYKPDVLVEAPTWVRVEKVYTEVSRDVCGEDRKKPHSAGWYLLRGGVILGTYMAGRARVP